MAEEIDKNPDSTGSDARANSKTEPFVAKVGDGGKVSGRSKLSYLGFLLAPFQLLRHRKRYVLYAIVLVVVLIGGWLFIKQTFHIGEKVYAQAAGHKVYKQDVKDLIGDTKGVSDHQAAGALADKYLLEAMAKEQSVKITDKDIQQQYGQNITAKDRKDPSYEYQQAVNNAYMAKMKAKYNGVYKGDLLVGHFDRYIPAFDVSAAYKKVVPQMGDPKAIEADKEYAKNFLTKLYNEIQGHKITWKQAIQAEHKDRRLGEVVYPSLSHSDSFDTSKGTVTLFDAPVAQAKVSALKAGETSKPFEVFIYNPNLKKTYSTYYMVVHLNYKYGGHVKGFFQEYLVSSKKKFDYQVNV
jgi:hypothetical protein